MFGQQKINESTPAEAAAQQKAGAVLLDVREDDEWAAGHALGATHVPLGRLAAVVAELGGRQVLTVCRGGGRSAKAAKALADAGVDVRDTWLAGCRLGRRQACRSCATTAPPAQ